MQSVRLGLWLITAIQLWNEVGYEFKIHFD
jgi:hypothetical protein